MNILPLTDERADDWHAIAAASPDAWFWHTPDWLAFVKAVGAQYFVEDLSALIYVNREPLAICPVILEERGGYRRFTYLGEFLPFPAFRPGVIESVRAKAIEHYAAWLDALAVVRDVAYTRVIIPALAERTGNGGADAWNPLLRHGYLDISTASQILDLRADVDALWQDVRKGHRSDIKRAAGSCDVRVWDDETITHETFDAYRTLHAIDAGRVTRGTATFDMMLGWIRKGNAVLVEARRGGEPVAFAVVILFGSGAYYASSCKHPDVDAPAIHLVQWETVKWLKAHGYRRYDLGLQYFGPAWTHVPSPKEISIARFKRGFGGATRRVDVAERFFSTAVLEQAGRERLQALIAAREHQPR
ncbi:MAG TPA: GNAT family N-acetyltransferase [Vicinamibacterales bacterium]|nr:GNAT family N-acetyltransferase [Vicinamibacterales bacterium]